MVRSPGRPEQSVQIGIGATPSLAWHSLEETAIQSVGRDTGEDAALSWAANAGWFDREDLEPCDDVIGDYVTEPLGDVDWEAAYGYVACLYGDDSSEPGDCRVRVGQDDAGLWWLDDGDDDCSESSGPYYDRASAEVAAKKLAQEQHEGEEGEDADAMIARLEAECAGEPCDDGDWCVYWLTGGDDEHVVARYDSEDAATAACDGRNRNLARQYPGGNLLCGYAVRRLVDGEWVAVDDTS